jgi:hypothetical protein
MITKIVVVGHPSFSWPRKPRLLEAAEAGAGIPMSAAGGTTGA